MNRKELIKLTRRINKNLFRNKLMITDILTAQFKTPYHPFAAGYYDHSIKRICIKTNETPSEVVLFLCHELTHTCEHQYLERNSEQMSKHDAIFWSIFAYIHNEVKNLIK